MPTISVFSHRLLVAILEEAIPVAVTLAAEQPRRPRADILVVAAATLGVARTPRRQLVVIPVSLQDIQERRRLTLTLPGGLTLLTRINPAKSLPQSFRELS